MGHPLGQFRFRAMSWLAVGLGAACGAWLRWRLSLWLNAMHPALPFGTLAANLAGGYLIGIAIGFFNTHAALDPAWRLLLVTGFLGGLTTFSAFSAESVQLLERGAYLPALLHAGLHLLGSILLCMAGLASYRSLAS
jgi:CrcB protein